MNSRHLLVSIGICFLIFSAFGCSPNSKEAKSKELVMWLVGSEGQAQSINELAQLFFQEKGIKVRCEAISWGDAHSRYLTAMAGKVTPDIGTMGLTWGTEFGSLGAMIDLNEIFSEDMKEIKTKIFPGLLNSIEYKGKTYGIPFDMTEHILYYRTDLIKTPPQTWTELVDMLEELHLQGRGLIFDWGSMNWLGFAPFLWQSGGDFYNSEMNASNLRSAESEISLRFFSELYTKYYVPKTNIPVEQGMRTGDFPLAISGNWKIEGLRLSAPEIAGRWSIAQLPVGPSGKRTAFIGGRIMGIFTQSKNKKSAWEFIKFLFRTDIQIKLYELAQKTQDTYLPPNLNTWDILPMDIEFRRILKSQALDAKGPPPVLGWDSSTRFIDEAVQRVIIEGAQPREALDIAAEEMEKLIKN